MVDQQRLSAMRPVDFGVRKRFFPCFRRSNRVARVGRLVPSWPLSVGLAAFIRALAQPMALLNDPDAYLHIAAGRWMPAQMRAIARPG